MIGAIIGDIVGSRFEGSNHKSKDFELFASDCRLTDDSIMTLAVGKAILEAEKTRGTSLNQNPFDSIDYDLLEALAVHYMQEIGRKYPDCGYGGNFMEWIFSTDPKPYNSYGNGAAMRVSPAGLAGRTEMDALERAKRVTKVSHNHKEGLKGAEAVTLAIYMARKGLSKSSIYSRINADYYSLDFKLDNIRDSYEFDVSCQGSVPQAIKAFIEAMSFEDAIRTAISIGGDSDTIAAITGSIAASFYGVPDSLKEKAFSYLDENLIKVYEEWQAFIDEQIKK
ncbi:ADP-ribosylglycohydrolase family protein [Alkalibacterium sp. f15]|uniref:ADP-ribosylglycohydrolase family protein n=1 Tax=Alkalibacterium sp. f15 TaxID=3414029 RepID=UPI003BF7E9E1